MLEDQPRDVQIHPGGHTNMFAKLCGSLSYTCWDVSVWIKVVDQLTKLQFMGLMAVNLLINEYSFQAPG